MRPFLYFLAGSATVGICILAAVTACHLGTTESAPASLTPDNRPAPATPSPIPPGVDLYLMPVGRDSVKISNARSIIYPSEGVVRVTTSNAETYEFSNIPYILAPANAVNSRATTTPAK